MQLKIDLHVHTDASKDGLSTVREMIESARRKGLDGIAVTDHDIPFPPGDAAELSTTTGTLIIPGMEVSTDSGHLLVLSPRSGYSRGVPLGATVERALSEGSAVIIPHPTDVQHSVGEAAVRSLAPKRLPIETINSSTLARFNRSAAELALELGLPCVGGSDAHIAKTVGDAYTVVEASERTVEKVLEGIRGGRTVARGGESSRLVWLETACRRLGKHAMLKRSP